ncbi:hypothetical protein [Sneathiella sp.]|uniref:hypothetical protein n=1 Tax=Sneathiella sp. TaxID=1964365 RepID=UPI003564F81C
MKKFSTDAAGFAALTLCELIVQQCVISGLFTPENATHLLKMAARRHQEAAEGTDDKIALNMEAAHLLCTLGSGLEPLFREHRERDIRSPASKPAKPSRPSWVAFPK